MRVGVDDFHDVSERAEQLKPREILHPAKTAGFRMTILVGLLKQKPEKSTPREIPHPANTAGFGMTILVGSSLYL
jgi:hypothetical protein